MENIKISDLITEKISGEWGTEFITEDAVNVIRTANFTNSGIISFKSIVKREIELKVVKKKRLLDGDIIIEKSGGSPSQPVGRVVYFEQPNEETFLCNNFTSILRPDRTKVSPKYLFYLLYNFYNTDQVLSFQNKTTGIINLKLDRYLDSEISYEPDLETQNKIVAILDKAKAILNKREEAIRKYDELPRATFIAMFGDPVLNPNEWKIDSLSNYGALKNGLNYNRDESGNQLKCLGISDFKSFWKLTNISSLSSINLTNKPSDDYFLQNGDLVFVRSNGNKQLVGRCMVVYPNEEKVTFSGFCIRYRPTSDKINTIYLAHLFREPNFRKVMLQHGRGANIQNISQQLLMGLKIPIPPIETQEEFAFRINQLELVLDKFGKSFNLSEQLLKSLSQQVFNDRIIIDVDTELEALISAIDLEMKDEGNKIDTIGNDVTLLQRLMDKLTDHEFETKEQYDKASYVLLRIMKEEEGLVKQIFKNDKIAITLLNETA